MQKRRKFLEKKKNLLKPKIKILHTLGKRSKREAEKKKIYLFHTCKINKCYTDTTQ